MRGSGSGSVLVALLVVIANADAIDVIRQQVSFEEDFTVTVDNNVEYILEFTPNGEQAQWPTRLRVSADGGDTARPVLLTARQTTGAQTWQLPYRTSDGSDLLFDMQRTLCFDASHSESYASASGQFSLHVSTAGAAGVAVRARADPARDWLLPFQRDVTHRVTLSMPRALYYRFPAEQERVRLVVASADDVCAIVGVHNYTCPVAELVDTVKDPGFYMTVQRSGAIQLSRRQFPDGFYVVVVVKASDKDCNGEESEEEPDWLWEAAIGGNTATQVTVPTPTGAAREKLITFTLKAALTRTQYAVATTVTLLVFLLFYAVFIGLVLSQRLDIVKRYVGPKAVLAENEGEANIIEDTSRRRRRRDSDATFDSVDDDSESEEEDDPASARLAPAPAAALRNAVNNAIGNADAVDANHVATNDITHTTHVTHGDVSTGNDVRNGSDVVNNDVVNNDVRGEIATPGAEPAVNTTQLASDGTRVNEDNVPTAMEAARAVAAGAGAAESPFGLPAQLRVAALARRRERTLRARADRYLHTLYTVALFYTLPVVQFVAAFQIVLNVSGSLDLCYYNFLCAHPLGLVSDFNHVVSNAGYLLLGGLFMLQVRRRRARRRRHPRRQGYGIPAHYGLLSSLGAGMMVVAILSASYHICPNALNFQFDTAFMYVLSALAVVKLYQARHPDINARAHHTFAVLALLIALVVWGVLGGGALFWAVCTTLHVFAFLLLSLRIYYVGQFTLDGSGLVEAARGLARPLYLPRLIMLLIANAANWGFALYGLITMPAVATHLLMVMLMNTILYMMFYLAMKLAAGERLRWYSWLFLVGAAAAWAPALYFFIAGSINGATPAQSRNLNHDCLILNFYDSHDIWHILSAVALYLSFNAILTWDDGLSEVKRTEIVVF